MKLNLFFLFLSSLVLFSCTETEWQRSEFDNGYSIEHPDYMKASGELKPGSVIQLENVNRELYFVMDVHPKSELENAGVDFDLLAFSNSLEESMLEGLRKAWRDEESDLMCGEWKARTFMVGGKTKFGPEITYMVTVVDAGKDFLVQTAWTPSAQKTSWFNEDMRRMMQSLQLKN